MIYVTEDLADGWSELNSVLLIKLSGNLELSENLWFALNTDLLTVGSCECPLCAVCATGQFCFDRPILTDICLLDFQGSIL